MSEEWCLSKSKKARNAEVTRLHAEDPVAWNGPALAKHFGVTTARIYQILKGASSVTYERKVAEYLHVRSP